MKSIAQVLGKDHWPSPLYDGQLRSKFLQRYVYIFVCLCHVVKYWSERTMHVSWGVPINYNQFKDRDTKNIWTYTLGDYCADTFLVDMWVWKLAMQSKRMYSQLLKDELVVMIRGNLIMCLVTLKTSCLFMFFFRPCCLYLLYLKDVIGVAVRKYWIVGVIDGICNMFNCD